MMSSALALKFLLLLCFKLIWAMPPQSFWQPPMWTPTPAHSQNGYANGQQGMSNGAYMPYTPYGMQMVPQYPYPYPYQMLTYASPQYAYVTPFPAYCAYQAPQQMSPGFTPVLNEQTAEGRVDRSQSSCPSASLKASSCAWDDTSRSISMPGPQTTTKTGISRVNFDPASVENKASGQTSSEPKEVLQSAPVRPVGNKASWSPKKLAPLNKPGSANSKDTAEKVKSTTKQQHQTYVPKTAPGAPVPVTYQAPSAPGPATESKPANPWAAKDISQKLRTQNYMPIEAHVRHAIYYLDPEQYKRAYASGVDPRDLAFAYIMIGQRLWNNVLYPLAQSLGTDFTTMLCHDVNAFEAAFFALDEDRQNMAINATFVENLNLTDIRFAARMYRNRLRICHPKQFPLKFKGGKSVESKMNFSILMTHFDYLYKWTGKNKAETAAKALETGYPINQQMTSMLAQRAHATQEEARKIGQQAYFGGNKAATIGGSTVPFAKEGETDATLALLYIWDHYRPTGNNATFHSLRTIRNTMAHQEGSDDMYEAYVHAIFSHQPDVQELLLACGRMEDLEEDIPQYVVDESVQYDNDYELEVIEEQTN